MALIAVLWITAALSLLAMSLSQMARTDVRVVTVFKQSIQAQSRADGALTVAADWLQSQLSSISGIREITVNVGGQPIVVQIAPSTGFINVNMASAKLLQDMFVYGAGLPEGRAAVLAKNVIAWRSPPGPQDTSGAEGEDAPRHAPFVTPQDLRQVSGITPDIYARIAPLIVANPQAAMNSLVNANAAPAGVLNVLAQGNRATVHQIISARAQLGDSPSPLPVSGLNPTYLEMSGSNYFRLTALVRDSDNILWKRTWWVDYSMQIQSVTPWRVAQIDPLTSAGVRAGKAQGQSGSAADRE